MFFTFPEEIRWNAARQTMEFGVEIGRDRFVDNSMSYPLR
jgi:hypothetical protein